MSEPRITEIGARPPHLVGHDLVRVYDVSTMRTRWRIGGVEVGSLSDRQWMEMPGDGIFDVVIDWNALPKQIEATGG